MLVNVKCIKLLPSTKVTIANLDYQQIAGISVRTIILETHVKINKAHKNAHLL